MESEIQNIEPKQTHPVFKVTTFSKYLALILFILLPFVGGLVGYVYAPEKVVEKTVIREQKGSTDTPENIYAYSKSDDLKLISRTEAQRIGLRISPFSDKYLDFQISAHVAVDEQPRYIDLIKFDQNSGEILLGENRLLRIHTYDDNLEESLMQIRLQELEDKEITSNIIQQRIQEYFEISDGEIIPVYKDVCSLYSWTSEGNTFYRFVPLDKETGTGLTSLCGYTSFVVIENLIIENFGLSMDATEPKVYGEVMLVGEYGAHLGL